MTVSYSGRFSSSSSCSSAHIWRYAVPPAGDASNGINATSARRRLSWNTESAL
jgi:hypothetical protein